MSIPLIFIVGPTSVGKSKLAIKIAKKIKGEIINADSMQVYSNLNILTARPTKKEIKFIPHHLYGYVDGSTRYNVAIWCNDIFNIIKKNNKKNIYSIIVGGTGMYIEKFINGLVEMPAIPEIIKNESAELLLTDGMEKFANRVKNIDEKEFIKISKNDKSRLRRIWEIYKYTNQTKSFWLNSKNKKYISDQEYQIYLFTPERKKIYEDVNKRFISMVEKGAINEVKKLQSLNLESSLPIMRAHGVPEISSYLEGLISLDECIEKGQQVTRNYVKRQLTWWRSSTLQIHRNFDQFPTEIDVNSLNFS